MIDHQFNLLLCPTSLVEDWGQKSEGTNPLKTALCFLVTNPHPETNYMWQALT